MRRYCEDTYVDERLGNITVVVYDRNRSRKQSIFTAVSDFALTKA